MPETLAMQIRSLLEQRVSLQRLCLLESVALKQHAARIVELGGSPPVGIDAITKQLEEMKASILSQGVAGDAAELDLARDAGTAAWGDNVRYFVFVHLGCGI
jgi:hypothetical protein